MDDGGSYWNVYAWAPGIDYNHCGGMCGNNNGNPNDDAVAYIVDNVNDLREDQRVTSANDLWTWKYTGGAATVTKPPYASECAYVAPVVSVPVLSNGG